MEYTKPKILNAFKHINKTNGFIVPILFFIFQLLKRISFFHYSYHLIGKFLEINLFLRTIYCQSCVLSLIY